MDISELTFLSRFHSEGEQPKSLVKTSEYCGQKDLRLACTQLALPSSQAKRILLEWCELLPSLSDVNVLYLYSRTPQVLFDSICKMPNLEALFIKWSGDGISDFSSFIKLKKLKSLYVSSCTRMFDLELIGALNNLEWLELHGLSNVSDITPLKNLANLKGLTFTGGRLYASGKKGSIESFEPLKGLVGLEHLKLTSLKVESEDLTPLTALKNLKYLNLSSSYSNKEFAKVYAALINCDHGLGPFKEYIEYCDKCMSTTKYTPWAKGKRSVCKKCSPKRYNAIHDEFFKYVHEFS